MTRRDGYSPELGNTAHSSGPFSKAAPNGFSKVHPSLNGSSSPHTNGHSVNGESHSIALSKDNAFFGHDREEVTRLIIQGLIDLGYQDSAHTLARESRYEVESPSVAAFKESVLRGEWSKAESILFGTKPANDHGGGVSIINGASEYHEGLRLIENADVDDVKFRIREQKYLELLEQGEKSNALKVLRQELTPLAQDRAKLHALSSLVVSPSTDDLQLQTGWDGAGGTSRKALLREVSRSISPSVMIPEHRLASLFDDFRYNQIANCRWHNTLAPKSLFVDHKCDQNSFPKHLIATFDGLVGEVWCIAYSHSGRYLAVCGKKGCVKIFDVEQGFKCRLTLGDHQASIAFIIWSPDDSKIISCSCDKTAKIWDVASKQCIYMTKQQQTPVSSATWAPDSKSFITASPDRVSQLVLYDLNGQELRHWDINYRAQDVAITPDGSRLIASSVDQDLFVYSVSNQQEQQRIQLTSRITCLSISRDSKFVLANLACGIVQLIDIENGLHIVRNFVGQKQGKCVIRSCFGGVDENLIISGSEGRPL